MPKKTPEMTFAGLFAMANDETASQNERDKAERAMVAWLKRYQKTRRDIGAILLQAEKDDQKANPPSPAPDPRASAPHPYDDPRFTPAGLVEGLTKKYVSMNEHVSVISSLWTCLTHVYTQFGVAPRLVLTSEEPESGKSTLRKVIWHLAHRPNRAALSTVALLVRFLDQGPGCVLLDELDHTDAKAKPGLIRLWNEGFERDAEWGLVIGGEEKLYKIFAPMLVAGLSKGVGKLLLRSQMTRGFKLDMQRYTEETRPEYNYRVNPHIEELDAVYAFLRHWAPRVRLNPDPPMPPGVDGRFADDLRGLVSIADSCCEEWGWRVRKTALWLLEKERAELPERIMVRHGLLIFAVLEPEGDQIWTVLLNQELKRLDLPDAMWGRYRGPEGVETAHPITMQEQGELLSKVGVHSETCWPPGPRIRGGAFRGYKLEQFRQAHREYGIATADDAELARARLRLAAP